MIKHRYKVLNVWEEKTLSPSMAIARHCLDCSQTMAERRECIVKDCVLWPFREGKSHTGRPPVSDEVRAANIERLQAYRYKRNAAICTAVGMGNSATDPKLDR